MDKRAFFNRMAAAWDERFYKPLMRERLPELVSHFHLKTAARVLDVGAGTGGIIPYLLEAIGPEGTLWAVDFAEEMAKIGQKKFERKSGVFFALADVESLPYEDNFFDHVVCFGAFPHFEDKRKALQEMGRVLKPRGTLIIAHALSSAEIRHHHENCAPVSRDFLPAQPEMRALLEEAAFQVKRLIDQPKCYLCEGVKPPFAHPSPGRGVLRGQSKRTKKSPVP